jgi:hypothetical protein
VSAKCANPLCSVPRHQDEGKLFRIDIEIGHTTSNDQTKTKTKTTFVWLCDRCARRMNPKVQVAGDTVRVLLAAIPATPLRLIPVN